MTSVVADTQVQYHWGMRTLRIPVAALSAVLLIVTAACGSPSEKRLRTCEEEVPTQTRPVTEQLACIHDVLQYKLDREIETGYSPSIVAGKSSITYRAALNSLVASGYMVEATQIHPTGQGWPQDMESVVGFYPTAEGMEYLKRHRHPVGYWIRENWFLLVVAGVNIVLGSAAAVNLWFKIREHQTND